MLCLDNIQMQIHFQHVISCHTYSTYVVRIATSLQLYVHTYVRTYVRKNVHLSPCSGQTGSGKTFTMMGKPYVLFIFLFVNIDVHIRI